MAVTHLNDRFLVEAHKAGDPEAFRAIVETHRSALHAHALRRLGDPAAAEDAVQETLLRAYRSLPRFNGQYRLAAWLHRILTNVCIDEAIRRQREADLVDRCAAQPIVLAPDADQALALDLPREEMKAALQSLPATHREALLLRFVDDLPYSQVAETAGVTEENARARVSRARSALRAMMKGAVAALVFVLPFGRKQDRAVATNVDVASSATAGSPAVPTAADAASAVSSVSASTVSSVSTVSSHLTPFAGAAAQIGDAAATGGMAVAGKVAVAVSVVAAVAVPTGAVISNRATATPAPVVAPAQEVDEALDPSSNNIGDTAIVLSSGPTDTSTDADGIGLEPGSESPSPTATASRGTKTSGSPSGGATSPTTAPEPGDGGGAEPAPAPPGGTFDGASIEVSEAGPRLQIDGRVVLDNGTEQIAGALTGKLLVDEADPKDPEAPRRLDGTLTFLADDGRTADVRLIGEVVVDDTESGGRSYEISGETRLSGDDLGIAQEGPFDAGIIRRSDGTGTLVLVINGGPAEDDGDGSGEASSASSTTTSPPSEG